MPSTTIEQLEGYAALMDEAAMRSDDASQVIHQIAHGNEQTDVLTESGPVPTHAKQARLYQESIPNAVIELSGQMANGRIYETFAEALQETAINQHFWMSPSGAGLDRVSLFQKTGTATYKFVFSYVGGSEMDALIRANTSADNEIEHLTIEDPEGARIARLTIKRFETLPFTAASEDGPTSIGDGEGAFPFYADDDRVLLGQLEIRPATCPGIYILDQEGGIHRDLAKESDGVEPETIPSPFENGLLFAPVIATGPGREAVLHVQNMLPRRDQAPLVFSTVFSTDTVATSAGRALLIDFERFGSSAVLNLRDMARPGDHRFMKLKLVRVPVQVPPKPIKILFIGDSIGNRQGGFFLRQYLEELGIAPTFLGTLPGSANATNANDTTGEMGECREGWETGDFTYAITDRVGKVVPGEEAAYMALSKPERWPINPFLRVATEADPPDIVRNGYVFDPAFYQARFGLDAPDIVINTLGTNDARDRTSETIYSHVLANDTLMHNQIKAAWPNAKIIRSIPGSAIDVTRNALWLSHYTPAIRAMQQAEKDLNYSRLILAPLWAMTDPESGYAMPSKAPGSDGFVTGNWADSTHPIGSSRLGLYAALAPFVAAAAINLI